MFNYFFSSPREGELELLAKRYLAAALGKEKQSGNERQIAKISHFMFRFDKEVHYIFLNIHLYEHYDQYLMIYR